jgi:hypothetical protein
LRKFLRDEVSVPLRAEIPKDINWNKANTVKMWSYLDASEAEKTLAGINAKEDVKDEEVRKAALQEQVEAAKLELAAASTAAALDQNNTNLVDAIQDIKAQIKKSTKQIGSLKKRLYLVNASFIVDGIKPVLRAAKAVLEDERKTESMSKLQNKLRTRS